MVAQFLCGGSMVQKAVPFRMGTRCAGYLYSYIYIPTLLAQT
jgi:hypothetical protein